MSAHEDYVEKCVAAVKSIDVSILGRQAIGPEIGAGTMFAARHAGKLGVLGADVHIAVKLPTRNIRDVELRAPFEIAAIDFLLQRMPQLKPQVPLFLAMVAIDGGEPRAILTEDVSRGGEIDIWPLRNNTDLASEIKETFDGSGDGIEVDEETAAYSLSFLAGDEVKLLDFTPPPIRTKNFCNVDRVYDLEDQRALIIDVSADSTFGNSLLALTPEQS